MKERKRMGSVGEKVNFFTKMVSFMKEVLFKILDMESAQ